jgi:predicted transcriptional regulator
MTAPTASLEAKRTSARRRRAVPAATQSTRVDLDRLLDLIERRTLSVLELRLLLQLEAGAATVPELAETLERETKDVLAAVRRLAQRGFVQRRSIGSHRQGLYCIARPGIVTIRPLLTAVDRSTAKTA